MTLIVREILDPKDPAISGFGRMQRAAYFAPETLIPAEYIPMMLDPASGAQTGDRHNHLVVAEKDGSVVGGALFHWLASAGVGFSSFMGVEHDLRGHGIGRRLHDARARILDQDSNGKCLGVFIDVVNPTRLTPEELERERRAVFDPWTRRKVFKHLGFKQVDIRYEQPVGGPNGGPVTNLDLLFCPATAKQDSRDALPTDLVVATMRAYWSGWLGDERAKRYADDLGARAHGEPEVALISPVPERPPY